MTISTIDQNNPYLQQYGGLTVSPDLAAQLAQQQMNANMMGQDAFGGVPVPEEGSSLLDFVTQLHFAGQPQLASDIATMNGIPQQDFTALVQQVNDATTRPNTTSNFLGTLADSYFHNPFLMAATGLAAAGVGGAAGAADGLGEITLPAGLDFLPSAAPGMIPGATGAALASIGTGGAALGALAGAGAAAAGGSAGAVPAGYSGLASIPGAADMVVSGAAPAAGGAGAAIGAGLGGAAAGAALGGAGGTVVPQGTTQGLPDPTQPGGAAAGGAAAGAAAGAGGLAGLSLADWLAIAGLGAGALQGNQDITQNRTAEPPAYLAPYLTDAAGAAQRAYAGGNYVAPVQQAASSYSTNVLNGDYLNANPWLDATFNKAAGAVTNQVQSNFGRAGRNVDGPDAAGVATDGYNDLATQIYGGNYQAERDRMQQIVPQANQLGAATNPNQSLDDYIARLNQLAGGYGTTSSRIPTQTNWGAGLAGLATLLGG